LCRGKTLAAQVAIVLNELLSTQAAAINLTSSFEKPPTPPRPFQADFAHMARVIGLQLGFQLQRQLEIISVLLHKYKYAGAGRQDKKKRKKPEKSQQQFLAESAAMQLLHGHAPFCTWHYKLRMCRC